jgi:hypothetical protein
VNLASADTQLAHNLKVSVRKSFESGTVDIDDCWFSDLHSRTADGGAVFSSHPATLHNCVFQTCEAAHGGAIASTATIIVSYVTMRHCSARESGGFDVRSESADDLTVDSTLFDHNQASYFGSFYRSAKAVFIVINTNISESEATQCVGCSELKSGAIELRFLVMSKSHAASHNGGICTRGLDSILVDHCVFLQCSHHTTEAETGAVFLFYDNPYESAIINTSFIHNEPNGSYTITVTSGHGLGLIGCCFTAADTVELHPGYMLYEGCTFSGAECKDEVGTKSFGFHPKAKRPVRGRPGLAGAAGRSWRKKAGLFFGSGVISVLLAAALTAAQAYFRHWLKGVTKIPKAIQ